jgi:hypothetical protein
LIRSAPYAAQTGQNPSTSCGQFRRQGGAELNDRAPSGRSQTRQRKTVIPTPRGYWLSIPARGIVAETKQKQKQIATSRTAFPKLNRQYSAAFVSRCAHSHGGCQHAVTTVGVVYNRGGAEFLARLQCTTATVQAPSAETLPSLSLPG